MVAVHSKGSRVLVNDVHVSGQLNAWSAQHSRQYGDATTFLSDAEQWTPGLCAGALTLGGLLDAAVALEDEVAAAMGVDNSLQAMVAVEGWTVGGLAICAITDPESLTIDASVKDNVALSASLKPDNALDFATILAAHAQVSADADGSSVDEGAATTTGGVAYLDLTQYAGLTNIVIKVQDSATGTSGWADIATFATLTGTGQEAKTIAGTIRQYVRATWDVTGTGTATFAVALARR